MLPVMPAELIGKFPMMCSFKGCSQCSTQAHATETLPVHGVCWQKNRLSKASRWELMEMKWTFHAKENRVGSRLIPGLSFICIPSSGESLVCFHVVQLNQSHKQKAKPGTAAPLANQGHQAEPYKCIQQHNNATLNLKLQPLNTDVLFRPFFSFKATTQHQN